MDKITSIGEELNKRIFGDQIVYFRPSSKSVQIENTCDYLYIQTINSKIIRNYKKDNVLVELCKLNGKQFKLLYRASRDRFEAASFHAKCDHQSRTLTIIKTNKGFIFGDYTAVAWDGKSRAKADPNAFIVSILNAFSTPQFIPIKPGEDKEAIHCDSRYGPTFGNDDIEVSNCSNSRTSSYSELGYNYDLPLFKYETT